MLFSEHTLAMLRDRVQLLEVLAPHVSLKQRGQFYKGICPFHEEKTPSFVVRAGERHYHCFGCGAHGDAIAFYMRYFHLSFAEAVERLASHYHISLNSESSSKALLYRAFQLAVEFYHSLLSPSPASSYLAKRSIGKKLSDRFALGYAPAKRNALSRHLQQEGIPKEILEEGGLTRGRDFFAQRLLIPIRDRWGNPIAFSGRALEDKVQPKYINTPESPIFKKSLTLFPLDIAGKGIAKGKSVLLVEGQIDAIRLIDAGFEHTLAIQGTAFNANHVNVLVKLQAEKACLAFDGDKAGKTAALQVGDQLQRVGIDVRIALLPEGLDPDSYVQKEGTNDFAALLEKAIPYLEWSFSFLQGDASRHRVVEKLVEQISHWQSPVLVHESLKELSRLAAIPLHLLRIPKTKPSPQMAAAPDVDIVLEEDLLCWLWLCAPVRADLLEICRQNLTPEALVNTTHRQLYIWYLQLADRGEKGDLFSIEGEDAREVIVRISKRKVTCSQAVQGLKQTIQRILERRWMSQRAALQKEIVETTDGEKTLQLVKEFDVLTKQMPKVR